MYFSTKDGDVHAVDDVSFTLDKGEVLGIAGESGSGKTSIALSILRLLPTNARFLEGKVLLDGEDLRLYSDTQLRQSVRWKRISLVSQAAMNALNPVFRIGDQIKEAISSHTEISDVVATSMVKKLLEEVGISQDRYSSYPHELSGGMKQRTIIAMALALDPDIVIADEPTTALDVIVQAQIISIVAQSSKIQEARNDFDHPRSFFGRRNVRQGSDPLRGANSRIWIRFQNIP